MTDFNITNKALKVAWILRLQTNTDASWKIIPEIALVDHGGLSFLTHCNYDINSLQLNRLPGFYHEVLKHWQSSKQAFQNNKSLQNEIIWNNRNIKIEGKTPFYKNWFEKNILRIKNLLQNDGSFLSFEQFSEKFHLETPFTLYFGLINSIPNDWKVTPRETVENGNHKTNIISTKNVYSAMLKHVFSPPTAESKILRYGFNRANLNKVYELPFQIKNDIDINVSI